MIRIQKAQACRFLLTRHGLLGAARFRGAQGMEDYVRMTGCVQYDPVDVCGRSHELAFLARVRGFTRELLDDLLYQKRSLIDYFDKNMCIMLTEDWPCLDFIREGFRRQTRSREAVEPVIPQVLEAVHRHGSLSARELDIPQKVDWPWGSTTLGRAALETLYFRGELVIHHKQGTQKSYALARDCLPADLLDAPSPFQNPLERQTWQVLRRIGAVGMLWNAGSDAWLGIEGMRAPERDAAFRLLLGYGQIVPVSVEGVGRPLFVRRDELPLLAECREAYPMERQARLLAPLDCLLWDRRLIDELFGFAYKWEVYTPREQRRYGYYVLPVVYGERFVGRVEPVCDRDADVLCVHGFWPEPGVVVSNQLLWGLEDALDRLRAFLRLKRVTWGQDWLHQV